MIKLNLLPAYIAEFRKMKIWGCVFAVLFVLEAGIILGWKDGLTKQTAWFKEDKESRCDAITSQCEGYTKKAKEIQTKNEVYKPWLDMFSGLLPARNTVEGIGASISEAAAKLGGDGSAYKKLVIRPSGDIEANGQITGALRFLNYYFRMKDEGYTLTPKVQVGALNQKVELIVTGKVAALPTPSSQPDFSSWKNLFNEVGAEAAGTAPAAAGGLVRPGMPAGMPGPPGGPRPPAGVGGAPRPPVTPVPGR